MYTNTFDAILVKVYGAGLPPAIEKEASFTAAVTTCETQIQKKMQIIATSTSRERWGGRSSGKEREREGGGRSSGKERERGKG